MSKTSVNTNNITQTDELNKCEEIKTSDLAATNNGNCSGHTESSEMSDVNEASYDLNKFQLQRILNNNTRNKSIALLGKFPYLSDTDRAIVIFEKRAFQESDVATKDSVETNGNKEQVVAQTTADSVSYFGNNLKVQTEFINNIYGSYQCIPPPELSSFKATVVYPATDKHIEKYSICKKFLINETPELYEQITLPYITSSQFSLEWVYNILEHKQEADRIIFEDPDPEIGFILLPDLKWDGRNVENLYVLAITHKHGIKSLRDLNGSHLPLLRNIRTRAVEAIAKKYGVLGTQLRMYFHYQPSFYHLHIHINPIQNDAPGIWCEKSHMLDTVINNLELLEDYYQKATLPFVLYDGNKLLGLYEAKIQIRKAIKRLADHEDHADEIKAKRLKITDATTVPDEVTATKAVTD
ncbi:hypothetical protein DOY81_001135 [Sarcophaga bullata]|nr:hypothetical protein DOY81_001135 [Sarcophaga bullata]